MKKRKLIILHDSNAHEGDQRRRRCGRSESLRTASHVLGKGGRTMNKILVTYATRAGSTFEVAARVAEVLRAAGATVDVKYVTAVHELEGYDAVVVGSSIRMGRWLPEAVAFVQAHRETLSHIPTTYFLVSGFLREDTPQMQRKVLAYLDPARKSLQPP